MMIIKHSKYFIVIFANVSLLITLRVLCLAGKNHTFREQPGFMNINMAYLHLSFMDSIQGGTPEFYKIKCYRKISVILKVLI